MAIAAEAIRKDSPEEIVAFLAELAEMEKEYAEPLPFDMRALAVHLMYERGHSIASLKAMTWPVIQSECEAMLRRRNPEN